MRRIRGLFVSLVALSALFAVPASSVAAANCGGSPDFDGDGRDDLAVGVPGQDVSGQDEAGAIHVIYGSAEGLSASGDQVFHQDTSGMAGESAYDDWFGSALASGDFDGDGRDDLAVGIPGKDPVVFGSSVYGAVHIIYGSAAGLTVSGDQIFDQGTSGVVEDPEETDLFGSSLAACDFNGDGEDDLAVGVPGESTPDDVDAGAINVLYGSPAGLTASGSQLFHEDSSGMADTAMSEDDFGHALTPGDFDGDGRADLAVGVQSKSVEGQPVAGSTHILYGSAAGLSASGDQVFNQGTPGMVEDATLFRRFGYSLISGDFNNDGRDDLVAGVPGHFRGGGNDGAVHVIYGSAAGLTTAGNAVFHRDSPGMAGDGGSNQEFGLSVGAGDFDGDGRDDLAVGVPLDSPGGFFGVGSIHVIYGTSTGLTASGDQIFSQDTSGMADEGTDQDHFGASVSGANFDNDGRDDLAVGVPGQFVSASPEAGAIHTIYGSSTGLSVSGDQVFHQDTPGIADAAGADELFGHALHLSPVVELILPL